MATASDNFNRANGPLGSNWTHRFGTEQTEVVSNVARNLFTAYDKWSYFSYSGASWGNTYQRVKCKVTTVGDRYVGVTAFCSGSGDSFNGVLFKTNGLPNIWNTNVGEFVNGTEQTLFEVNASFAPGDEMELEVDTVNDVIRVFKNGTQIGSDFTYTRNFSSGEPGLLTRGSGAELDDWWATDAPGGPPTLEQEGFRFGADAAESSPSWLAAQDADLTAPSDQTVILNVLLNATGNVGAVTPKLQFRKVGENTWQDVPIQ